MSTAAPDVFVLRPIGRVESSLLDKATAPKQGDVRSLEAIDGTPILDVKPVLDRILEK